MAYHPIFTRDAPNFLALRQRCFPDILKTAVISPIFKNGNWEDIRNYRPISLLNSPSFWRTDLQVPTYAVSRNVCLKIWSEAITNKKQLDAGCYIRGLCKGI
ncbi:unnamed protein product [Ceutorhynchus assimilis]|uniref:Uncharacterized protein n=1 Tax=Ceutorhynchus assimilis TaxID=467358 RepID=A0A9N9QPE6_9CUCU|nr:unnamed protein product [Ceutorhynchus assimilis]